MWIDIALMWDNENYYLIAYGPVYVTYYSCAYAGYDWR